jgi:nitrite reductase/ring-hydroxylating ferredoxin subunit
MSMMIRTLRRADLPDNGVLTFEVGGVHYVVLDADGDVCAFAVSGPAAHDLDRAVVADGRLRCPLHGWPIDPRVGRCGAADLCRYETVPVEVDDDEIRVVLPTP